MNYTKDTLIEDVTMSSRLRKFLSENKKFSQAKKIEDLVGISINRITKIKGIGPATLRELKTIVAYANNDSTEAYFLKIKVLKVNFNTQTLVFLSEKNRYDVAAVFFELKRLTKMFDLEISSATVVSDVLTGKVLSKTIEEDTIYQFAGENETDE